MTSTLPLPDLNAGAWPVSLFDPASATPEQKLAVGRLLADSFAYANPEDPPLIPEQEAVGLSHQLPTERKHHLVVWQGAQALAWGCLEYDTEQNTHMAHARLVVAPQARRQGLGRTLGGQLRDMAMQAGRTVLTFGTTSRVPAGEAFAQATGAQAALPMRQSRLPLSGLDRDLLARWQGRPEGDPYRLHLWTTVPDAYLDRAADMMMVMNTAPKGDLEQDDWRITPEMIRAWDAMIEEAGEVRTMMAIEDTRTGALDAYSEIFWTPERQGPVFQGATAVRPGARGQGLGKWVKAAMLEHILATVPGARWVQTNNAHENAAMLGINVTLGFTPWSTFTEWQLKLA
ncbi:GNAT family N-acetyltransferase [Deinococcus multiflagellatus]|uniref:GNAT family N-acetyltransferase n=1 Tax=Deinococcus multiflagellatus TaxID=1656887 RepID=A0ABW1ZJA3_9DEIO|nr:GNAT family N-acetyltransferase [Deinococcus multiflagellatus]MBZ9712323.1 GNAT family N-acetyltransferase [Deinococcus multiflagellatus]